MRGTMCGRAHAPTSLPGPRQEKGEDATKPQKGPGQRCAKERQKSLLGVPVCQGGSLLCCLLLSRVNQRLRPKSSKCSLALPQPQSLAGLEKERLLGKVGLVLLQPLWPSRPRPYPLLQKTRQFLSGGKVGEAGGSGLRGRWCKELPSLLYLPGAKVREFLTRQRRGTKNFSQVAQRLSSGPPSLNQPKTTQEQSHALGSGEGVPSSQASASLPLWLPWTWTGSLCGQQSLFCLACFL